MNRIKKCARKPSILIITFKVWPVLRIYESGPTYTKTLRGPNGNRVTLAPPMENYANELTFPAWFPTIFLLNFWQFPTWFLTNFLFDFWLVSCLISYLFYLSYEPVLLSFLRYENWFWKGSPFSTSLAQQMPSSNQQESLKQWPTEVRLVVKPSPNFAWFPLAWGTAGTVVITSVSGHLARPRHPPSQS